MGWRVGTSDDVQPLLHVALVLELRVCGGAGCGEERVEVELVELSLTGDSEQLVRHLVGEQPHLRQRPVRTPGARLVTCVIFFGPLFIGVGPVEDLFLDELARRQRPEGRAG